MAGKQNYVVTADLQTGKFKAGANALRREFASLKSSFVGFTSALGASFAVFNIVSRMRDVATNLSVARATLKNTSKTAEEFSSNLSFVDRLSKTYKQEVVSLTDSFAKFHAAAEGTNFSLQQQKDMFEGLTKAAAFYHMSAQRTEDMLVAVEQMMSKGKVTAEELRRQLGNNLPGAYAKMAKAAIDTGYAGVKSFADFEKAMKAGKIGVDLLDTFIKNLQKDVDNIDLDSLQLKANDLSNAFTRFVESSEFEKVLGEIYDRLKDFLDWLSNNFTAVFRTIETLFITVFSVKAIKAVATLWKALKGVYAGFMAGLKKVLTAIGTIGSNTATLAKLVNGLRFGSVFGAWAAIIGLVATGISKIRTEVKNFKKDVEDATDALKQMASADWDTKDAQQRYEKAKEWAESSDAWLKEHHDKHQENLSRKEYLEGPNYVAPAFVTNAGQMRMAEIERLDREIKLYNDKQEEYAQAMLKMKEAERDLKKIAAGEGTTPTGNTVSETSDFEKAVEKYRKAQKELDNQFKANTITAQEYADETAKLTDKSWKAITAFDNYRGEIAKLDSTLKPAAERLEKAFGENGLRQSFVEIGEAAKDYYKEQVKNKAMFDAGYLSQKDYDEALEKAGEKAIEAMAGINGLANVIALLDPLTQQLIGNIISTYKKGLNETPDSSKLSDLQAAYQEAITKPKVNHRFDYEKSQEEIIRAEAEAAAEWAENIKKFKEKYADELSQLSKEQLDNIEALGREAAESATNLTDLADVTKWLQDVKNLRKELDKGIYGSVKDTAEAMDRLTSGAKSFKKTMEDTDSTVWDKILESINLLIQSIDTVNSLVESYIALSEISKNLSKVKNDEEMRALGTKLAGETGLISVKKIELAVDKLAEAQAKKNATASLAAGAANSAEAVGGAVAAGAKIPFPQNIIAMGIGAATAAGLITGMVKMVKANFASGGIVGGGSYHGDKVLAGLNSGEMILNGNQQSRLWGWLNGRGAPQGNGGGQVEFVISGQNLKGVLKNYETIRKG